jgi:transcriptional regulator with XRE-family HTH domain
VSEARTAASAPTVLRVVLGKRLQDLRERAGLSFEDAARALDVTHATIRRMEKAEAGLKLPYVEKLLHTYGISESSDVEDFLNLCRDANRPGWWHRFRDVLPDWFSAFVSLEGAAELIRSYEPHYVPGLLQTHDYAQAVLRAGRPGASPAEVERAVALRLERQTLLERKHPPMLWVVMDETVLCRPIGGETVMRAQIAHLIEAAERPHVRLQVVPFATGPHPAMYGPFHIFRFPLRELPDVAYVENLVGAAYLEDRDDVSAFREALDRMSAQALTTEETRVFLQQAHDGR